VALGVVCGLLREKLEGMGSEWVDRGALAERLGYRTGEGGVAARKIAALVHFDFLVRSEGGYRLSESGTRLQELEEDSPELHAAIQQALQQPVLFDGILRRFQPFGHVSRTELRKALTDDFGITEQAKDEAAEIFLESAQFAGVLRSDGSFADSEPIKKSEREADPPVKRLEILVAPQRSAWLEFPTDLDPEGLKALSDALPSVLAQIQAYVRRPEPQADVIPLRALKYRRPEPSEDR